ncbi:hypothetical protein EYB25_003253 [Talaromyces marneffei]|nr:hypothetical protein EYB25_003253 [Talaromyces marneffei]
MAEPTEREKMLRGELYRAFTPELIAARVQCEQAYKHFNSESLNGEISRRRQIELWRALVQDTRPLPPPAENQEADDALLRNEPWVQAPISMDYGFNVKVGEGVFINVNCVIIDTCLVTVGARTLFGPNVHLYSGTHPLDSAVRNGTLGPEMGKEIHIGEDCWLGGNVIVLPGVTIGRGCTIGAGSVVTKDVPAFHVAAGNPARIIRKIETSMSEES